MSAARAAVVGAFVTGGLLLFGAALFFVGDRRLLFSRQFEIATTFGRVTGLQVGTKVRVAGLDAGEILEIMIPSRPAEKFRVRMRLRDDLRQLVRADSVCAVQTDGIVGNAFIQISPGSDDAPMVSPGDTIAGNDPIEFADLIQEGRDTFRTVSREAINLTGHVSNTIDALTETVRTANGVFADVGDELKAITRTGARVVEDVRMVLADTRDVVSDVKAGRGTVGQLLTDDNLYRRLTAVGNEAEQTARNLRETTDRARAMMDNFTARDGAAQQVVQALRAVLVQTEEVMADLTEATESLKRNFLFRGFFRRRGFFDLDAIARDDYLAGALEGRDRTALRIWIAADLLFTRSTDGAEVLTEPGRQRLDSAMADLVRYPRDSPLVVEGYAEGTEMETAYLASTVRAQIVRDYLLSRFRRKVTLTDIMPMADEASGSPSGDGRWSGVALALFVPNDAFAHAASER